MIKAVIYARCAEKNDDKIASQLSVCKDYAVKNDMSILAEYADNGYSGMSAKRPSLKSLQVNNDWEVLLITECSVLYRDHDLLMRFMDSVEKNGRKIILTASGEELSFSVTRKLLRNMGVAH